MTFGNPTGIASDLRKRRLRATSRPLGGRLYIVDTLIPEVSRSMSEGKTVLNATGALAVNRPHKLAFNPAFHGEGGTLYDSERVVAFCAGYDHTSTVIASGEGPSFGGITCVIAPSIGPAFILGTDILGDVIGTFQEANWQIPAFSSEGSADFGNATTTEEFSELEYVDTEMVKWFRQALQWAAFQEFGDDVESEFAEELHSFISQHGNAAVNAIEKVLLEREGTSEAARETIRELGSVIDPNSHAKRLNLLMGRLASRDPRIRDAASLGIADMNDPRALEAIQTAIGRESNPLLLKDLELVLRQLQAITDDKLS